MVKQEQHLKIQGIKGEPNKHLTQNQRIEIQECLTHGMTFKTIANRIGKSQTTVSREVKQHITVQPSRAKAGNAIKPCLYLLKAPFVCNGCEKRNRCWLERHFYYAKYAHEEYKSLLTECRTGIALNNEQFYHNDAILKEGVEKGQHIYHIAQSNNLNVSLPTIYRYIHQGYSAISAIDLPRVVKFKPRNQKPKELIPSATRRGRTYDCFEEYCQNYQMTNWLEMDTVIGRIGGKVLLTFATTDCNFMFARLADDKTAVSISAQLQLLKERLAAADIQFGNLFPLVLTDNGGEFANVSSLESNQVGHQESKLFFCDPGAAYQKPHVEKVHTMLRDILPKGASFDLLTQEKVDLICSHVNGVLRNDLSGKSAYDVFAYIHGSQVALALGIVRIEPQNVIQSPILLNK